MVSPWVYPVWDSLCLLDLIGYFLFHVEEILNYNLSKIFSYPFFFSSSSVTPIIRMLVHLTLSQRLLRLSSVLFIHSYFILFFRSYFYHFIFQLTDSFFCFRYSAIDSFQNNLNFSNCVVCLCRFIL